MFVDVSDEKKNIHLPFYTTLLAMAIILLPLSPGSSSVLDICLFTWDHPNPWRRRGYRIQTPIHQHQHSTHNKKQKSQKCYQEPIFKIYWSCSRCPNTTLTKKMLFAKSRRPYKRDSWTNIAILLNVFIEQAKRSTQNKSGFAALENFYAYLYMLYKSNFVSLLLLKVPFIIA